jgi:hypothetical protein
MKEQNIGTIGTLKISKRLQKIIDYLHYKIGATEWSGILFYKLVKGDIKDLGNLEFEATFMYPMNIGSSTYTEFDYTGELVTAYDVYEQGIEESTSLIHSHHSMQAFHSGTDLKELSDNADKYNYYISLVVNFSHTYCAKIAIPASTVITYTSWIKNTIGKLVSFIGERKEKELLLGDLTIVYEEECTNESWLDTRIKDLEEAKKKITISPFQQGRFGTDYDEYPVNFHKWLEKSNKVGVNFKENTVKPTTVKKDVTANQFLSALLQLDDTKLTNFETVLKDNLFLTSEDLDQLEEALSENLEIIHENVYGKDKDIRNTCIEALCELHTYSEKYSKYQVFDVLDLILCEYVAI